MLPVCSPSLHTKNTIKSTKKQQTHKSKADQSENDFASTPHTQINGQVENIAATKNMQPYIKHKSKQNSKLRNLYNCNITTTTLHLFSGLFSGTTWVSWYQKATTVFMLKTTARGIIITSESFTEILVNRKTKPSKSKLTSGLAAYYKI